MKVKIAILFGMLVPTNLLFAQEWQQTASTPEGAGVTEIIIHPENDNIFVTTAAFNWPNGDDGGVRRSTDDGNTWENLYDAYSGRTITLGADGHLYASIWPYPSAEGVYRSTDNGDTWQLLTTVPTGNNIFSITFSTSTSPATIFAGTRQGVYRSSDNGINWAYSSSGIAPNSWVRDIEVDSSGIVVAATTNGQYSSDDNGDSWQLATGGGIENDTITKIIFDYPLVGEKDETRLISGTSNGKLYESFDQSMYLTASMVMIFGNVEVSGLVRNYLALENKKVHGISKWPEGTQPGGFSLSNDNGVTWQKNNMGLPGPQVPSSALSSATNDTNISYGLGLFQNMNGGAQVFRLNVSWSSILDVEDHLQSINSGLNLRNFPNPFSKETVIHYRLANKSQTELKIYSATGQLISTFVDDEKSLGEHHVSFKAENLEAGIYYCKMECKGISVTTKMVLLR